MAETTSQLQQKLMALTNGKVNIMLNADEFKSTTQILREMAAVWQDMTDVQQAAALELLGGKRQANILSSLLQNFQTVEDVIQTSMASSGSALRENEVWLDSIEGKTYQFTNALQTMWSNILDSEAIKGFIDFGTDAIQFLDTAHGKVIALVAAVKLMAKFKGFSLTGITKGLMQSIQQINVAQSALKVLPQINNANGSFFVSNINAYASAVSGLTPKLQAQALVTKGLNDEQIRSVMAINGVDQANIKLALSQVRVSNATKQQIAFSGQEAAAILASKNVTLSKIATDWLSKQAKDEVTEASVRQAMSTGVLTKSEGAAIISTLGLSGANLGLAGSFKAVGTAIGFMFKSNPIGFILSLVTTVLGAISIFDSFGSSIEDVSQKVNELKTEYESLKETTKNNLTKLTESSDVKLYATLAEEFTELTKGVNNLGENVSLTSEQYERYRSICEDIVSISPALARGHNSATEAINNNADALANLIELEKEKQRQNALNYTTGENWDTLVEDSLAQYKDVLDKRQSIMGSLGYAKAMTNRMGEQLRTYTKESQLFKALLEEYNISDTVSADAVANDSVKNFKELLSSLGYTQLGIDDIIETYTYTGNPGNGDNTMVGIGAWIEDNIEMLQDNVHLLKGTFAEAVSAYEAATNELNIAQTSMIETLLEVPTSMKAYGNLSDSNKSFINDWIQNSGMFEIDENTTAETMLKWKNTIKGFIGNLESDAYTYTLSDGTIVSAKDIIDSIYSLDPKGIDWSQYQAQMNTLLDYLWQAIGAENNTLGITDKNALALTFGFDLQLEDKNESQMIARYAELKDMTTEEAKAYFDSLPAIVVQRLLKVDWNLVDKSNVDSTIANAMGSSSSNVITSKTYSVLSEKASEFNDVLSQTQEVIADNTEVTQEYKDSLTGLGISEEDLADCFDENNPLIVKNAKALNNLVKTSSKNIANNVKLAKSQARLEYYKLVKQLNSTLNSTKRLNNETRESIKATLDQIDAVELAAYKYKLLEDSLLGTTNAFEEFTKAQEIDALNTYGDIGTEAAQVIYDAFYKTGEVGTEAFNAAIDFFIPESAYADIEDGAERLQAKLKYFNENIAPMFNLEDDQFSLDYKSVEWFINKGLSEEVGVFEGAFENFTISDKFFDSLKEGEDGLDGLARAYNITREAAYMWLSTVDKFNGDERELSLLEQFDTSIEGQIMRLTNELEQLNKQKLALLEDGGYEKNKAEIDKINTKIQQTGSELNKTGQEAYDMWQKYTENEATLASLEEISKTQENLTKEQAVTLGVKWDEKNGLTVQQAIDQLLEKKLKLEEPTVLTAQFAVDYIYSEIDRIEALLANPVQLEVEAEKAGQTVREFAAELKTELDGLKSDAATIATVFGIELDEDQQKTIKEELEDVEEITIHDKKFKVTATGLSTVVRQMKELIDLARELDGIDISGIDLNTSSSPTRDSNGIYLGDSYHPWGSGGRIPEYANGTFHMPNSAFADGSVGAPRTETALVGELGPELLVRNGRWTTIGENGAEFTQVKKNDIIFNHQQTRDLLSKGYITSRGKAFASGTAYVSPHTPISPDSSLNNNPGNELSGNNNNGGDDELTDEFEEYFDWIEVKLEEINDSINLNGAKLENAVGTSAQNAIIDDMIAGNQELYSTLVTAADAYYSHAQDLLAKVPADLREAAKNGQIAIELFTKDAGEEAINAIQEYREWVQKGDEATQQAEETIAEIRSLAKQAFDNIATDYENQRSLRDNRTDQLESYNALSEAKYGSESTAIYEALIKNNKGNIALLKEQRNAMQANLNAQVRSGDIKKYSQDWYDAVNDIAAVDNEIIELTADTYDYIDAMGEIHWDNLDNVLSRFEAISNEVENLLDILDNKDMVDKAGNWTPEGITSLGLYAQQMEIAEVQAKKYQDEIAYLNKNWKSLGLTEQEYIEKLDELKSGQYDSIKAYHEAKNAIVDLNKTRIDAIKNGIEKEIDAYEELIKKKKEALDADKDLYDFEKSVNEQQKNIATIERKLAALATDNSTSAAAQRKKLEEELLEAKGELEDTFYDRSIQNQQDALDKELENFQNAKEEEKEGWDQYLENTETVVSDSLATIQANTDVVYQTLKSMGQEYGLTIAETLTSPWRDGEDAIQSYAEKFGLSMSSTVEELQKLAAEYEKIMKEIEGFGEKVVNQVDKNAQSYVSANNPSGKNNKPSSPSKDTTPSKTPTKQREESKSITVGGKINAGSARIYANSDGGGGSKQYFSSDPIYVVLGEQNGYLKVRHHSVSSGVTGWFKKSDVKAYAKGTTGVPSDQIAWLDELGEELVMHADGNGRLAFLSKGTSVIPANLTKNLMKLGELNPQDILDRSRPIISAPHIVNNEINIDMNFGSVVNVEHVDNDTLPDLAKTVEQQMDKYMKKLNSEIRKYAR